MLKEHDSFFRRLLIAVDLLLVVSSFFIGHYVKNYLGFLYGSDAVHEISPVSDYYSLIPLVAILWVGALYFFDAYRTFRGRDISESLLAICKAGFAATIIFGALAYLFKAQYLSRVYVSVVFTVSGIVLGLERVLLITMLRYYRRKGFNYRYILIVGTGAKAESFLELINSHPEWGFRIAGIVDEGPDQLGREIMGSKIIGTLSDVPDILERMVVDDVVFIVPRTWLGKIEDAVLHCEQVGKRVSVAIDYFNLKFAKAKQTDLAGFPLLMFESAPQAIWQLPVKRVVHATVSAVTLVVLIPFFLVIAVIIKLTSKGPVFFKQIRSGLNGREFTLYKFRTMIEGAEAKLEELRRHNEMSGPVFKMENDPRLTPIGKWMRKLSIDEFPQLFNVFNGDMSLVGPRPPLPSEVKHYAPWQRRRLSMRPGITCLWQVKGRNKIVDFDEWMRLDLQYIDNWSLWLDQMILLRTVPVVLFAVGAK